MEGRINRIGQMRDTVRYYTFYSGILGNIKKHYDSARSLSNAIRSAAKELGVPAKMLRQ